MLDVSNLASFLYIIMIFIPIDEYCTSFRPYCNTRHVIFCRMLFVHHSVRLFGQISGGVIVGSWSSGQYLPCCTVPLLLCRWVVLHYTPDYLKNILCRTVPLRWCAFFWPQSDPVFFSLGWGWMVLWCLCGTGATSFFFRPCFCVCHNNYWFVLGISKPLQ